MEYIRSELNIANNLFYSVSGPSLLTSQSIQYHFVDNGRNLHHFQTVTVHLRFRSTMLFKQRGTCPFDKLIIMLLTTMQIWDKWLYEFESKNVAINWLHRSCCRLENSNYIIGQFSAAVGVLSVLLRRKFYCTIFFKFVA